MVRRLGTQAAVSGAMLLATVLVGAREAAADPLFETPTLGRGRFFGENPGDAASGGLTLDARVLGVIDASSGAAWPDLGDGITSHRPAVLAAQVGFLTNLREAPWTFLVRLDLAEPFRPDRTTGTLPLVDLVTEDFYAIWRPSTVAELVLGRARVPWSKWRQWDERDEPLGSPGFLVDRVAPDRRWGATFIGDLGAIGYAAGAYEDLDSLEPRGAVGDPSAGGQLAVAGSVEWSPRAPMYGSDPVGKVPGARGPLPTPTRDPWFATGRVSFGIGVLWRRHTDGTRRLDSAFSLEWKWRRLGGVVEAICTDSCGKPGAHADVMVTPIDPLAFTARAEWDPGAGTDGQWSLSGGATWHFTADRLNKVSLLGWRRQDRALGTRLDGVVLLVEAGL